MGESIERAKSEHTAAIDNRREAVLTGIGEVSAYDSSAVIASSPLGQLVVRGELLKIKSFDRTSGRLVVEGKIESLQYAEPRDERPLLKRMFG